MKLQTENKGNKYEWKLQRYEKKCGENLNFINDPLEWAIVGWKKNGIWRFGVRIKKNKRLESFSSIKK